MVSGPPPPLAERNLRVALPSTHPLAVNDSVDVGDLRGQQWIASQSSGDEPQLGVWPGLGGRPEVAHVARDWLAKLHLVAAGCGLTTVTADFSAAVRVVEALRTAITGAAAT